MCHHDYKLFLNFSRLNVGKHFFGERIVTVWNNLECSVIDFSSIKRFKTSLLLCELTKYVRLTVYYFVTPYILCFYIVFNTV